MMQFQLPTSNCRGTTLIETLIGFAMILAAVSAATALFVSSKQQAVALNLQLAKSQFEHVLAQKILNDDLCSSALEGIALSTDFKANIAQMDIGGKQGVIQPGSDNSRNTVYGAGSNLHVTAMRLDLIPVDPTNAPNQYAGDLIVEYQRSDRKLSSGRNQSMAQFSVPISVWTRNGTLNIRKCGSTSAMTRKDYVDLCGDVGGTIDVTTGACSVPADYEGKGPDVPCMLDGKVRPDNWSGSRTIRKQLDAAGQFFANCTYNLTCSNSSLQASNFNCTYYSARGGTP